MHPATRQPPAQLPRNVWLLGFASLMNDVATEMVFPLLAKFSTEVLKTSNKELGLIEGTADSLASLLKLGAGSWSDSVGRRKPFIWIGYLLAVLARPALALATSPWHLLLARTGDRFGKGIRSAARDALIVESVAPNQKGRAFGFRQAMDHVGATTGPLLALGFFFFFPGEYRWLFLATLLPGIVVMLLLSGVREARVVPEERPKFALTLAPFGKQFRAYLAVLALFTLACSSDVFILLMANKLGAGPYEALGFWALFSAAKAAGNLWIGPRVDRFGARQYILGGWFLYAACYLGLAFVSAAWQVWAVLLIYSFYYSLTEPAEKTLVVELAGTERKALAFGWFHAILGLMTLPAGLLFGTIADAFAGLAGLRLAFLVGAGIALLAAGCFYWLVPAGGQVAVEVPEYETPDEA